MYDYRNALRQQETANELATQTYLAGLDTDELDNAADAAFDSLGGRVVPMWEGGQAA